MTCNNGALQISAVSDLIVLVVNIVRILMAVAGAIGVVMLLVASIYYITSTGDPGRTKTAKDIIQYTVIGLIVILVGYGAMSFVAAAL
ncbi:MAG TPA: hypothetical protein VHQ86_00355 [Candidatus Saccharimonadia bacterium]|jgi:hypothetical protein|nr:hypothetical protein [Candidatus Saccharimonadia bacterium]